MVRKFTESDGRAGMQNKITSQAALGAKMASEKPRRGLGVMQVSLWSTFSKLAISPRQWGVKTNVRRSHLPVSKGQGKEAVSLHAVGWIRNLTSDGDVESNPGPPKALVGHDDMDCDATH